MNIRLMLVLLACPVTPVLAEEVGSKGKYFVYNGTKYMTQGAESVSAPGQTGSVTGKGLTGPFYRNGFGHYSYTHTGGVGTGTEFTITGTLVADGNADITLAAGKKLDVGVSADTTVDHSKSYKGLFVGVSDWSQVIDELNAAAGSAPAGSAIFKRNFRVVDSVLYVTGYSTETDVTLNGEVRLDLQPNNEVAVVGSVTGSGQKTDSLVLSDNSTLAFSTRHVCWQDRKVVDVVPDVLGKVRPRDCKRYK